MTQLDPAKLTRAASEDTVTKTKPHAVALELLPAAASHNRLEAKSVQNLDPAWLKILSNNVSPSLVNAVWSQLLREVFQYPGFVIAPDYYTISPRYKKVDLVACAPTKFNPRDTVAPVFAYQGKEGPTSDPDFQNAVGQAAEYLQDMYGLKNGRKYGMVGAGRKVVILEYAEGGEKNQVKQVYGPDLSRDVADDIKIWDIVTEAEKIDKVLGAILQMVLAT